MLNPEPGRRGIEHDVLHNTRPYAENEPDERMHEDATLNTIEASTAIHEKT
jgi:hypothetical protein